MSEVIVAPEPAEPMVIVQQPQEQPSLVVLNPGTGLPQTEEDPVALAALAAHIESDTPHRAYDTIPSLALIYSTARI